VIKPEDIDKHVMAEIDCVREDCVKESMGSNSVDKTYSAQNSQLVVP
jgi:hypothetical protein